MADKVEKSLRKKIKRLKEQVAYLEESNRAMRGTCIRPRCIGCPYLINKGEKQNVLDVYGLDSTQLLGNQI